MAIGAIDAAASVRRCDPFVYEHRSHCNGRWSIGVFGEQYFRWVCVGFRAALWNASRRERGGFVDVLLQEVFPEAAIVMIVVTTGIVTREKRHVGVARTLLDNVGMAFDAKVDGHCVPFGLRSGRPMLGVTSDALRGVDFFELFGIARIVELAQRVRVGGFALLAVTLQAGIIRDAFEWRCVTPIARHFDLMMAMRSRTGQKDGLVLRSKAIRTVSTHEPRDQ